LAVDHPGFAHAYPRLGPYTSLIWQLGASTADIGWRRLRRERRPANWSFRHELVLRTMQRHAAQMDHLPIELVRAHTERLSRHLRPPNGIVQRRQTIDGIVCHRLNASTPAAHSDTKLLLYLHGGGYAFGSPNTHLEMAGLLSKFAGVQAILPAYRLAPEHPYPAALDDVDLIWHALRRAGWAANQLLLAGDSAGGGLALGLVLRLLAAGEALPRRVALLSPWVDLSLDASRHAETPCDYLTTSAVQRFAWLYTRGHDPRDPFASPRFADFSGIPPTLIQAGEVEALRHQIEDFATQAIDDGAELNLEIWPGMFHVWQAFSRFLPEGSSALKCVAEFLTSR